MIAIRQAPTSVLKLLDAVPADLPVALLMRHSVRDDLPPGEDGNTLPITEVGVQLANELGARIGERLMSLHTSPLIRCVQTAQALRHGARVNVEILSDRLLGDPGIFVLDGTRAWRHWQERGHEGVMTHLASHEDALEGMARPAPASRFLAHHMLCAAKGNPGLHIFVTHDSLITTTASWMFGTSLGQDEWPCYLDAAFFWADGGVHIAYHDQTLTREDPLCGLNEEDVIEFARREIVGIVGLNSGARFFLAGGAFKTLLTGRPPHTLNFWAPSLDDRELLIQAIKQQGAQVHTSGPFADVFSIRDRVVEVSHKVELSNLEALLASFELGLFLVGVEHQRDGGWRAMIDPQVHDL